VDEEPTTAETQGHEELRYQGRVEDRRALERLIFFSDAVFAIAMTLLVLNIPKPLPDEAFRAFLGEEEGAFIGYFISFWVIALYWIGHHRLFRFVRAYDQGTITINLVLLFFVAFLPYPSAILSERSQDAGRTIFYALAVTAVGLSSAGLSWYSVFFRRFAGPRPSRIARFHVLRALFAPAVFLASIPFAVIGHVGVAQSIWLLTFLPLAFGPWITRRLESTG
jgi:TMEM175 potassium channel family protein